MIREIRPASIHPIHSPPHEAMQTAGARAQLLRIAIDDIQGVFRDLEFNAVNRHQPLLLLQGRPLHTLPKNPPQVPTALSPEPVPGHIENQRFQFLIESVDEVGMRHQSGIQASTEVVVGIGLPFYKKTPSRFRAFFERQQAVPKIEGRCSKDLRQARLQPLEVKLAGPFAFELELLPLHGTALSVLPFQLGLNRGLQFGTLRKQPPVQGKKNTPSIAGMLRCAQVDHQLAIFHEREKHMTLRLVGNRSPDRLILQGRLVKPAAMSLDPVV